MVIRITGRERFEPPLIMETEKSKDILISFIP
jgi:hypothetical protein